MKKPIQTRLQYLRFVLPFLVLVSLAACGVGTDTHLINYKGTCSQQTQQFMDYVHSLVLDELTPVIEDGFNLGPTADVMKRIEELNTGISKLNTPECNPRTRAVKDALLQYMFETRSYFIIVAGRSIYGEGSVQGQWTKMYEAGFSFENAFADLLK